MKPRHMAQKWSNDEAPNLYNFNLNNCTGSRDDNDDDDDEYDDVFLKKATESKSDDAVEQNSSFNPLKVESDVPKSRSLKSADIDYLRSKVSINFSDSSDDESDGSDDTSSMDGKIKQKSLRNINITSTEHVPTYTVSDDNFVTKETVNLVPIITTNSKTKSNITHSSNLETTNYIKLKSNSEPNIIKKNVNDSDSYHNEIIVNDEDLNSIVEDEGNNNAEIESKIRRTGRLNC